MWRHRGTSPTDAERRRLLRADGQVKQRGGVAVRRMTGCTELFRLVSLWRTGAHVIGGGPPTRPFRPSNPNPSLPSVPSPATPPAPQRRTDVERPDPAELVREGEFSGWPATKAAAGRARSCWQYAAADNQRDV
jgi:hypothetical protein